MRLNHPARHLRPPGLGTCTPGQRLVHGQTEPPATPSTFVSSLHNPSHTMHRARTLKKGLGSSACEADSAENKQAGWRCGKMYTEEGDAPASWRREGLNSRKSGKALLRRHPSWILSDNRRLASTKEGSKSSVCKGTAARKDVGPPNQVAARIHPRQDQGHRN